jgi:signal transduction histidine kinase/CheY-like chemotaxis protein/GAF domain-containing protein
MAANEHGESGTPTPQGRFADEVQLSVSDQEALLLGQQAGRMASFASVLVVDDEPYILDLISRLLRRSGYEVEVADDGFVALERLRDKARTGDGGYGLVLSDLKMPGIDGLRVLQEVTEHYPDTMFVLVTGFATLDSAVAALRQGAYDYLTKPLDLEHLISTVQRALEHRALMLQNKLLLNYLQEQNLVLDSLHREEQRKARQLRQVNAIARQITAILDVEALIAKVVELVGPAFDFDAFSFGLVQNQEASPRDEEIVFRGGKLDRQRVPVIDSSFWRLTDGGQRPHVRSSSSNMSPYDLVFPLRAGSKMVGFWVADWAKGAESRQTVCSPQQYLPYLEALGAQTVAVLENARLYALARKADELAFLNRVGRAASWSLDLEKTIQSVLTCVREPFGASLVEICLLDQQGEIEHVFSLVQEHGPGGKGTQPLPLFRRHAVPLLGHGLLRRIKGSPEGRTSSTTRPRSDSSLIAHDRAEVERLCDWPPHVLPGDRDLQSVLTKEGRAERRFDERASPFDKLRAGPSIPRSLRSLLGVSLHFGDRPIGVLSVGSVDPGAYDAESGRLLQVVAGRVAAAIENARLFTEVESGRRMILESHNTLQTLFDGILEGIYIVDRGEKVLAANRTQAGWAGVGVDELVGLPAERAFPTSRCSLPLIRETFETGNRASRTERRRMADGRWTEWEIATYPIRSAQDRPMSSDRGMRISSSDGEHGSTGEVSDQGVDRVVVVVRDVTEQRVLEASLIQSEKLAALGTLAAGIAHEINNPMAILSTNAQILREEIPPSHPCYDSVELIERASERASKIARNLLDFSRFEEFDMMPTDVNASIREAISLVESRLRRARIQVLTRLDPDLPITLASPHHLQAVWLNLLMNAHDAIQELDREGRVRVISQRHDDRIAVHIADNGVGIPRDQIKRIYDPFFTTKGPGKGTGLGLFTCYRTVVRHGGEIRVDSRVGEGTVFQILLPVRQDATRTEG